MVWKQTLKLSLGLALLLSGCAERNGDAGCLGGANTCGSITIPTESQSSSVYSETSTFSCSATAYPTQVGVGEQVRVQIDTFGGTGNKSVPGYITSFADSTSILGQYNADKAGTIVTRTITVKDSAGKSAACEFAVEVLDGTSSDGFACKIEVAPDLINPGAAAQFTFTAINAPGAVTFANFQANANWKVPAANLVPQSSTVTKAQVQYDYVGTKIASIEASAAGRKVLCRKAFQVGTSNASTAVAALTGCNVETAPLGYGADGSAASLAGTLTRVRAIPKGGSAPFTLTHKGNSNSGSNVDKLYTAATVGPTAVPQLVMRFQRPGAPLIKVEIKDALGKTAQCQSYHISQPNDAYAVAADAADTGTLGAKVKVYKGLTPITLDEFQAFESTYRGNVRIATADFDGDGIADTLAATNAAGGGRLKVFKGSNTASYVSKPAPAAILETVAGFNEALVDFAIGAGDINRDGRADIVLASGCGTAAPRLRILDGSDSTKILANFPVPAFNGLATGIAGLALADIDNDGYADVIASSCSTGYVRVFSGKNIQDNFTANPTNNLVPTIVGTLAAYPGYAGPISVAAGDVNNDGNADLLLGGGDRSLYAAYAPQPKVYYGANYSQTLQINALPNHNGLLQVGAADLNGDGYSEILFAGGTPGATKEASLEIHDGNGAVNYGPGLYKKSFNPFAGFLGSLFLGAGGI